MLQGDIVFTGPSSGHSNDDSQPSTYFSSVQLIAIIPLVDFHASHHNKVYTPLQSILPLTRASQVVVLKTLLRTSCRWQLTNLVQNSS